MVMQGVVLLIDTRPLVVEKRRAHRGTYTFERSACGPLMNCKSRGTLEPDIHLLCMKNSYEQVNQFLTINGIVNDSCAQNLAHTDTE